MFDRLRHSVLEVSIGGNPVRQRPSAFQLTTDQGFPSVMARLLYPRAMAVGTDGDTITVSLSSGGTSQLLFTGEVYDATDRGAFHELALTDDYKKLRDTQIVPSYRKEMAEVILRDCLGAAGVEASAITCPPVELSRFSFPRLPVSLCITLLVKALEEHGYDDLRYFFDAANVFRFGTLDDTGINEGVEVTFETDRHVIHRGFGRIETLPLPIRHSQTVRVGATTVMPVRTDLTISRSSSRLVLWMKEVA